ncbi:arylsulfatase A-like enzyme [Haloactinopolyspora alba]|uniref:Arylsulfatase A-like enzyme n=2 Tax=Haloactinopolyspora alba TaxID=648780 RepID=A0A2P8EBG9_9ACTN|nr:arylsulfatase [Haloactinopolyspora alba]PSL06806.1 arylsulfatase A-like enzyme [Haloactinopolyspora alba]
MRPFSTGNRPNVVLICVDQWRGDCLSAAGHPVVRTPYLDALASEGANFTRAYSATPSCVPARMALMTGLTQRSHRRVGYSDGHAFDVATTLPGEFRRHGYHTQAIGKMHVHPPRTRVGFDDVILHDGYLHFTRERETTAELYDDYLPWLRDQPGQARRADYAEHGLNPNSIVARPWSREERLHPTNWVAEQAIDWLYRRDPTAPFFLYLSFHRPHPPYDPPAWAFDQYADHDYEPPVGDWWETFTDWRRDHDPAAQCAVYDGLSAKRARAGYYGHMSHIDQQINRFLTALAEFELRDDTYLMFVSDHGELMGDHNLYRKSLPYEGSSRIPFILSGPADAQLHAGATPHQIVELRDVMPTLLDCADLPIPDTVEGHSVLPLARGENPGWRSHLHGEDIPIAADVGSAQWITTDQYKYVWMSRQGIEQLFDLHHDPTELHDLAADPTYADALRQCRDLLVQGLAGREEGYVQNGRLVAGQRPVTLLSKT